MSQLEERLLAKVQPLKGPSQLQLEHNHQKGKQCRACRTLRRISRDSKEQALYSEYARGATEIVKELIRGSAEIVGDGEGAVGQILGRMVQNPDPVVYGLAAGSGLLALAWFIEAFPRLAKFGHLDSLGRNLNLAQPPGADLLNDTAKCAQADINKITAAGLPVPSQFYAIRDYAAKVGPAFKVDATILNVLSPFTPLGPVVQWLIGAAGSQAPDICKALDDFTTNYIASKPPPGGGPPVHGPGRTAPFP